jgi:hypothetical protein
VGIHGKFEKKGKNNKKSPLFPNITNNLSCSNVATDFSTGVTI